MITLVCVLFFFSKKYMAHAHTDRLCLLSMTAIINFTNATAVSILQTFLMGMGVLSAGDSSSELLSFRVRWSNKAATSSLASCTRPRLARRTWGGRQTTMELEHASLLTMLVLKQQHSGMPRSIPLLLLPWLLASPGHRQLWYWKRDSTTQGLFWASTQPMRVSK